MKREKSKQEKTQSESIKRPEQDPANERDIMFWISDLPDSYLLEADQAGRRKQKGGKRMQKMIWTGIGVSAAAVIGTVSLFGTGRLHSNNVAQTPAQLEQTIPETAESATTQNDLEDKSAIGDLDAYYGVIIEIGEDYICVQGLNDNEKSHRGTTKYSKADIAAVSGSVGDVACTGVGDLNVGDRVCIIEDGSVEENGQGSFHGAAKIILISRENNQITQSSEVLTVQ